MQNSKVLIVEDEMLVAELIGMYLSELGYSISGKAISYQQAVEACGIETPDIVLLDIRLSGTKTGIDVAHWLRANHPQVPFIFLTAQFDSQYLQLIQQTQPAGYLSKPINRESLLATMGVALQNRKQTMELKEGDKTLLVNIADIQFACAEHVYTKVYIIGKAKPLLLRESLTSFSSRLPENRFLKVHRSYIINPAHVSGFSKTEIFIGEHVIKVSKAFQELIQQIRLGK
ncbi:MAG: response regulator [Bacteroidetes bacterium]|nr:response regulator [Bacteroidota bacterium]